MILNIKDMAKDNNKRKYKDRGVAAPSIPKAGITKTRRRLENGGKATKQFIQDRITLDKNNTNDTFSIYIR